MTTEFDSSGFSAFDKFFGEGTGKAKEQRKFTESSTSSGRGKRRGGVGVNSTEGKSATKKKSPDLLAKALLSVDRKRLRENSCGEYEGDDVDDDGIHDAEADGGRTSILQVKTTASKRIDRKVKNTTSKKNLGKKERERLKHAINIEVFDEDANDEHNRNIDVTSNRRNIQSSERNIELADKRVKRKRRKIRSRQKNIRKDNRSVDEKPAHLVPGNRNYQGRPMTQTTREKLNLPPPKKNEHLQKFDMDLECNSSLYVIDRNQDSGWGDVGVKLAVDELISSVSNNDVHKTATLNESEDTESRKHSKKKKKRFRNLV